MVWTWCYMQAWVATLTPPCAVTLWYLAIRCGEPQDIVNGILERKCQTFGCRISYACEPGYQLVGRMHRLQIQEQILLWATIITDTVKLMVLGVPKYFLSANVRKIRSQQSKLCTYNDASRVLPSPVNPPFGRVMFNSVTYNSLISYECNYGYMMVGETVRRCERTKIWTGLQPICRGNTTS